MTMNQRQACFCALCVLSVTALGAVAQDNADDENWISLFNGEDLEGWTPKFRGYELGVNYGDTFRVEDGLLKVRYDQYEEFRGEFGHLFYKDPFKNYRLRVEYRFVGEQLKGGPGWAWRNNGIMIHGQPPETMGKDQSFPVSIEVQLLGGPEKGERPTANLCTPGTNVVMNGELVLRHVTNSNSETYRGDQWVTVEVEVRGNKITHYVEGEKVLEYTDPQLDDERDEDARRLAHAGYPKMLTGGTISLQSETHPTDFRKIEILVLDE